ncbi:MAG: TonB-dependent receptor [Paludibacter sp.]
MIKHLKYLVVAVSLLLTSTIQAQVTTSGMSGKVVSKGETIIGAAVMVVHTPSGTQYGTVTNTDGRFNISGMRVGGPYEVKISYVGFQTLIVKGVILNLGETENLSAELKEKSTELKETIVEAKRTVAKNSTITNIGAEQISKIPTISRSINDFTKLSPFSGAGNSFAGRDGRYNTITLDGASLNNSFGLSTKNLPGGDAQPVSLDAIDAISVNVSPYDVKYSNFTGAAINVVTKSGTNKIKGTAYTFQRPTSFTGNMVDTFEVANANTRKAETYGFTIGAPIIKNKLFIFINAEIEKETFPGIEWKPSTTGTGDLNTKTSRTTEADLETMKNFLNTTYNYDAGKYKDFGSFQTGNTKIMARLDWNINSKNKFMLRFNAVDSKNDQAVNATSAPNPRSTDRLGINSIAFSNSNYKFHNVVTSITGELNSVINSKISNKLLGTYTHIQDTRSELGTPFPFVDIYKGGSQYMSFGTELFTPNNNVINNVLSFIDNVSITLNQHYITAGLSFEKQYFYNSFLRYPYGYYRYASMDDFMQNKKPLAYGLTYGYNGNDAPGAELNFGMGGAYVQDEWYITDNLRITGGLRLDLPMYFDKMSGNSAILTKSFSDIGDTLTNKRIIDVSKWPASKVLFSPRLGFKWDVNNDRSLVLNGGTGLFTGLLPFVWFTNQPTNAGTLQNTVEITDAAKLTTITFKESYKDVIAANPTLFPSTPSNTVPGSIAFVDPNFQMPQVWRSSLGVDIELPYGFDLSLNGLFTKDIYNVVQLNVNEKAPTGTFTGSGADNRPYYTTNVNGTRRINTAISNSMMLANGKEKGYQYSLNASLSKRLIAGFTGMISYTYTNAQDMSANPGSSAASAWSANTAVGSLNDPGLSYSGFAVPHRIVSSLSYEVNLLDFSKTTFSLFYSGSHTGRISYTGSNDLNWDGNTSDLIYVPATADELTFADITSGTPAVVTYTAAQQKTDFWAYVEGNDYLSSRKGKYAERYGDLRPWLNRFDFKVAENFDIKMGTNNYGLEISLNVLNVGNMLNSSWGTYKTMGNLSFDNSQVIKLKTISATGIPSYQLNAVNPAGFVATTTWKHNVSTSSTWGMILGAKISF